jgi:hypothetical protein
VKTRADTEVAAETETCSGTIEVMESGNIITGEDVPDQDTGTTMTGEDAIRTSEIPTGAEIASHGPEVGPEAGLPGSAITIDMIDVIRIEGETMSAIHLYLAKLCATTLSTTTYSLTQHTCNLQHAGNMDQVLLRLTLHI